jgi:serine/threonine-protein kinase
MEISSGGNPAGGIVRCPQCGNAITTPQKLILQGMTIGDYSLESLLGAGGMGEVWLANQKSLGRKAAVKILSQKFSGNSEFIARFIREMKLVGLLDHPNIVRAYEAGYDKGFYFLATFYVKGKTLESIQNDGKIFDEKAALEIVAKVAEALKYAWTKHSVLHRDIKPANIMIDDEGAVKLVDMGISKTLGKSDSLTMTGVILGTPSYMSPEQAMSEKNIDHRSDIYSLGATLYHMMTGVVPYQATNAMGIIARHISESLPSPRKINPAISPGAEALLNKMMAKDKHGRQETWDELIEDIKAVLGGALPSKVEKEKENLILKNNAAIKAVLPETRRKLGIAGGILGIALLIAAILVFVGRTGQNTKSGEDSPFSQIESEKKSGDEISSYPVSVPEKKAVIPEAPAFPVEPEINPLNLPQNDSGTADASKNSDMPHMDDDKKNAPRKHPAFLDLDDEKKARIKEIAARDKKGLRTLKELALKGGHTRAEMFLKSKALRLKTETEAKTILNEEQFAIFTTYLEEERRKEFKELMSNFSEKRRDKRNTKE